MTIRSTVKVKYTKQLKMLRIENGQHLSNGRGVYDWSLQHVYINLFTTHKALRKNDKRPALSCKSRFTYNLMIKYPALASALWAEMKYVNSAFTPITIYGKVHEIPTWGEN